MSLLFAQSPLNSGSTSDSFTLHSYGSEQNHNSVFYVLWSRDAGAITADQGYDIDTDAVVTVRQLQNDGTTELTLFTGRNADLVAGVGVGTFQPDPNGGTMSVTNNGPGKLAGVQIHDELPR